VTTQHMQEEQHYMQSSAIVQDVQIQGCKWCGGEKSLRRFKNNHQVLEKNLLLL